MFYESLSSFLDTGSGTILPIEDNGEEYWKKELDIVWKSGIHFVAWRSLFRRGLTMYCVMRDGQSVSQQFYSAKSEDELLRMMQYVINDIEDGKYNNKKTLSEQIRAKVEERGLVSYMNNTKWHEFLNAVMEKAPRNCLQYKTVFEDAPPVGYWDIFSDEDIMHMNLAQIEWLKIKHVLTEKTHIGALVPCKTVTHDKKDDILQILNDYNISYEYDEKEQAFIVYGYKQPSLID